MMACGFSLISMLLGLMIGRNSQQLVMWSSFVATAVAARPPAPMKPQPAITTGEDHVVMDVAARISL